MNWFHITDPNDPKLDELAKEYALHPLHIEDCRHRNQRAKLEETEGYLFVVLKPVEIAGDGSMEFVDLDLFVGRDFCITVQEEPCASVTQATALVERLGNGQRPDQIFYRVFDTIVDSYFPAIDRVGDRIDELEDVILHQPTTKELDEIFQIKRALMDLRRVLVNTRDVSLLVQKNGHPLISSDLSPFFRDIFDHIARNLDSVEMHRDMLTGALDVYLSSVANRTNQVMKVLTVLSTIALPSIVISGIYGMNLTNIPFLNTPHGVWIVLGTMLFSTVGLLAMLKRFGWW